MGHDFEGGVTWDHETYEFVEWVDADLAGAALSRSGHELTFRADDPLLVKTPELQRWIEDVADVDAPASWVVDSREEP